MLDGVFSMPLLTKTNKNGLKYLLKTLMRSSDHVFVNIAVGLSGKALLFAKSMVKSVLSTTLQVKRVWYMHTYYDANNNVRRYSEGNNEDNIGLIVMLKQLLFIVFNGFLVVLFSNFLKLCKLFLGVKIKDKGSSSGGKKW